MIKLNHPAIDPAASDVLIAFISKADVTIEIEGNKKTNLYRDTG